MPFIDQKADVLKTPDFQNICLLIFIRASGGKDNRDQNRL